jgi:hypothetical protein
MPLAGMSDEPVTMAVVERYNGRGRGGHKKLFLVWQQVAVLVAGCTSATPSALNNALSSRSQYVQHHTEYDTLQAGPTLTALKDLGLVAHSLKRVTLVSHVMVAGVLGDMANRGSLEVGLRQRLRLACSVFRDMRAVDIAVAAATTDTATPSLAAQADAFSAAAAAAAAAALQLGPAHAQRLGSLDDAVRTQYYYTDAECFSPLAAMPQPLVITGTQAGARHIFPDDAWKHAPISREIERLQEWYSSPNSMRLGRRVKQSTFKNNYVGILKALAFYAQR